MRREGNLHIIIAEISPVLSAGFSHCLRRLPGMQVNIMEVKSPSALADCVRSNTPDIILVNPTFGGIFNPEHFRADTGCQNCKIIAIEVGKLSHQAADLYDGLISVIDDMETITRKIKSLSTHQSESTEEKESLSQREKEIISLVVKGMTNQEIADKLFLSIHKFESSLVYPVNSRSARETQGNNTRKKPKGCNVVLLFGCAHTHNLESF